nr:hypothetical protein [Streptomyces anulatus]
MWLAVRAGFAERGLVRAIPLTLTAVCLIALFQMAQRQQSPCWGYGLVRDVGFVRAADAWWLALVRTPLSLFVPAVDLPVWGAVAQVLLVFGISEITLGRRRTLLIAYLCTLAGVLYARIGVAIGPDGVLGLPVADAHVVDTGPSGAVVGLAMYVCLRFRAWSTGALRPLPSRRQTCSFLPEQVARPTPGPLVRHFLTPVERIVLSGVNSQVCGRDPSHGRVLTAEAARASRHSSVASCARALPMSETISPAFGARCRLRYSRASQLR